jgi:uncharacterized 2Fe-2S/4Fe-4S cluster protein (DUF4445 family)
MAELFHIDFEPLGRRGEARSGTTLLAAAQEAGVGLASVCGGVGTCEECRVRLVTGRLSPLTLVEESVFTQSECEAGFRLACQAEPLSDIKLDIPPESLTAAQRLQVEGQEIGVSLSPAVRALDLELAAPGLDDLRSDLSRLRDGLAAQGINSAVLTTPLLRHLSEMLRQQSWHARLVLKGKQIVAVLPPGSLLYGLAVDIGTTKLAAYLVDLQNGKTVAKAGAMNPQIAYGEDAISRIAYASREAEGAGRLQAVLMERLNQLIAEMAAEAHLNPSQVVDGVLVGNTAMHHLFAGLPVHQLGQAPFVASVSECLNLPAQDLGLKLAQGALVFLPPNIAGFVGADHISMLIATGAWKSKRNVIALDIGTNTEISLITRGKISSCSCASGPAFEGAHIRDGMRAAPGAIERARWNEGKILWQSIEGQPPVGICGSGILDIVAALLDGNMLKPTGTLKIDSGSEYELVAAAQAGHRHAVVVTRKDIHEIQLAKSAIRSGIEVLLEDAGLGSEAIDEFIVAGAFGTYLDLRSAVRVGMFPPLPMERFRQVGNAAGVGAKQLLLSSELRQEAEEIARRIHYVELTAQRSFTPLFMKYLSFNGD